MVVAMRLLLIIGLSFLPALCSGLSVPNQFLLFIKSRIVTIIDKSNPGTKCASDLQIFISDLLDYKLWAVQMLDASGKIHPGILNGNIFQFGNYDECLAISRKRNGSFIEGQYCTAFLVPNDYSTHLDMIKVFGLRINLRDDVSPATEYFKITFGLCMPRTCSSEDLQRMWDYTEKMYKLPLHAVFEEDLCIYKEKPIGTYGIDFYVFFFYGIVLVAVISSTIYDVYLRQNGQKADIFVTFSLYTNTLKLLSTHCENNKLTCLYGIRILSMIWIILGHMCLVNVVSANTNTVSIILELLNSFQITFVTGSSFMVDTFFSVSGILVAYVQLKYAEKFKISLFEFYVHRLLRLFPTLFATVLFYLSIMKHLSDGPFWPFIIRKFAGNCYTNWWTTLFFFSNFIPVTDQCIGNAWYLAIDTQLYFLAPIILYNIKKYPKTVLAGMTLTCLICTVYSFNVTVVKNLGSTLFDGGINYHSTFYRSTLTRMPSWLIGISVGLLLYHHSKKEFKISKIVNLILLTLSLCSMMGLILYQVTFTKYEHNVLRSAFYNALSNPLWSLAVCYIIFSCSTGNGGFVNTFLSHPVFIVLGKLSYSIYLVHFGVLLVLAGYQRQAGHLGKLELFREFWGDIVIILACSAIMCLIFETPVVALLQHLEQRKMGTRSIFKESEKSV